MRCVLLSDPKHLSVLRRVPTKTRLESRMKNPKCNPCFLYDTFCWAGQKVWVYRNTVLAMPWFSSVRQIMDDPLYDVWFLHFKNGTDGKGQCPNNLLLVWPMQHT